MAIVAFVTSELAHADVKEESGNTLLSEDTMFLFLRFHLTRTEQPYPLVWEVFSCSRLAAGGNTAVTCGRLRV